ncbi:MAG: hypothetical protein AB1765_03085 [Candidatus Hydrogenedentota bacterium]
MKKTVLYFWLFLILGISCGKKEEVIKFVGFYRSECPEIQKLKVNFTNTTDNDISPHFFIQQVPYQPGYWRIIKGSKIVSPAKTEIYVIKSPYDDYGLMPEKEAVISIRDKNYQYAQKIRIPEIELPPIFNPDFSYYRFNNSRLIRVPMHWKVEKINMRDDSFNIIRDKVNNIYYQIIFPVQKEKSKVRISQNIDYLNKPLTILLRSNISATKNNTIIIRLRFADTIIDYVLRDDLDSPKTIKRNKNHIVISLRYSRDKLTRLVLKPFAYLSIKDASSKKIFLELNIFVENNKEKYYFVLDRIKYAI